jgi:hypothetical protein
LTGTNSDSRVWSAAVVMSLGKRMLKKSALDCYKRDLRQVSLQTIRDRAVCKTQAGNVFKDRLTETAGNRATNEIAPVVRSTKT